MARARTLRGKLARWIFLSTALSLAVFGVAAWIVVSLHEEGEVLEGGVAEPPSEVRDEVLLAMAFATPVGLGLATLGALLLTRRALRPVDRIIEEAALMGASDLGRRLPVPADDGELRTLVTTLNGLLERVERGQAGLALFAADASHELRTPLAVLASELEVALRRSRTPAEWEAVARTSLDEVQRLSRLVSGLLALARADVVPQAGTALELGVLLEQVVAGQQPAASAAGVSLQLEVAAPPGACALRGSPEALASAIGNVVGNAIRYTPRGGRVLVTLARHGGELSITVADDGPGLAPEELERVFEPFARGVQGNRVDGSPGAVPGVGLGLAITRRIVERHGGQVRAEPRAPAGARFVLTLPAATTPS